MDAALIEKLGGELFSALQERRTVAPLTARHPEITIGDAYRISLHFLEARKQSGERVIGKKIGVTSKPVQRALDVHQPDFGYLTDRMKYRDGSDMDISTRLIQPRAEGEIAFVLKRRLRGPGVSAADALAATDHVLPCFEIVDSRIENWRIRIQDTVADNASSGLFVVGTSPVLPERVDFVTCGMMVEKNEEIISTGAGAAALGSPLNCVAWLANTLGEYGVSLEPGEVILSGSLVPLEPVVAGDRMRATIGTIGTVSVQFT